MNRPKGYALVLGAGASYGGKFKTDLTPPLDTGAFQLIEKLCRRKNGSNTVSGLKPRWNTFLRDSKKAEVSKTRILEARIEEIATLLEARSSIPGLKKKSGRPPKYSEALASLKVLICSLLAHTNGTSVCELHRELITWMEPKAVVTFNYDLVVDATLANLGRLSWGNKLYAGSSKAFQIEGGGRLDKKSLRASRLKDSIDLFKLHGSINWHRLNANSFSLQLGKNRSILDENRLQADYKHYPADPELILPVAAKTEIGDDAFGSIWKGALNRLAEAKGWIVWGYSFPVTDTNALVLFQTALKRRKEPKKIIVINPDYQVVGRLRRLLNVSENSINYYPHIERYLFRYSRLTVGAQ
jgi:hypothetical protein